jgi:hypothetical protein
MVWPITCSGAVSCGDLESRRSNRTDSGKCGEYAQVGRVRRTEVVDVEQVGKHMRAGMG